VTRARRRGPRLLTQVVIAGAIFLAVVAAGLIVSLDASRQSRDSVAVRERADAVADRTARAFKLLLDLESSQRGFLITRQESMLEPWRAARSGLPGALRGVEAAARRVGQGQTAARFSREALAYLHRFSEPLVATARQNPGKARDIVADGAGRRRMDALRTTAGTLFTSNGKAVAGRGQAAQRALRRSTGVQTAALLASGLLVLGFVVFLNISILRPVRLTAAAARAFRRGDRSARVPVKRTHELGVLAAAFNEMAAALQGGELEMEARAQQLEVARRDAEAADVAKSEFLSRMSHELRTPLNAILGFGQLLELDELSPQQREATQHIMKAGRHLLELINEILDISRIESGELKVSLEPVCVPELLGEAMSMIAPLADARSVTLRQDGTCDEHDHVRADRQRLKQVMLNLLANAVKYNRPGGDVCVRCVDVEGVTLSISVVDSGIGIAEHDIDRLFRPFERLHHDDPAIEGTGLGLALTKRLVEAMEGEIHVASQIGRGSVFSVLLPIAKAPADDGSLAELRPAGDPEPVGSPRTVLYIEDNASNVKLIETVLVRRPEVTLMVAVQGSLGLELAIEHRPSLVLLDLDLPDMPGDQVLRRLLADPRGRDLRVVVVSADATPRQIERLMALGAHGYLSKPFDVAELLAAIDESSPDVAGAIWDVPAGETVPG
jgi:signal transduction histidine kinase/ActR/RegA family two-component response regulator